MSSTQQAPSRKTAPEKQHSNGLDHPTHPASHEQNGRERARVVEIQRARMLNAMADVACERGPINVTVAHVVGRAGVSRRTFYELFDDRDDCFQATLEEALDQAAARVVPAYRQPTRWRERVRNGLTALLSFLEEEPSMGRVLIVETLAAGQLALRRRNEVLDRVIAAVDEGRHEAQRAAASNRLTAEGAVGAVLSVLHARVSEDEPGALIGLLNPLMSMIVLPYLGAAAARRELECPLPSVTGASVHRGANPLKQLGMRLTYRTARVLLAVADAPGASNRAVGTGAGIADQGQISKLLSRLEKLGLVVNQGLAPGQGTPNAWTLTETGEEVCRALAGHV